MILRGLIALDSQDEGLQAVHVTTPLQQIYAFFDQRLVDYEARLHAEHLLQQQINLDPASATLAPL